MFPPPRLLGASRTLHSYPLKWRETEGGEVAPFATATAETAPPSVGSTFIVAGGRYPGSTNKAAYSVPRWVALLHFELGWIFVKGWLTSGCSHHAPLLEYKTICCPGRAPATRPSMMSCFSRPPSSACGTRVNSIEGPTPACGERQLFNKIQLTTRTALFQVRSLWTAHGRNLTSAPT